MRPKIYAHRGASRQQRENSVEAFRVAAELGADGVELDVRRALSGELVVHHDAYAEGVLIARADRRALPSHVPDLGDALDACSGLRVNIEIKIDDPHKRESFELAQEVAQHLRSRAEPVGRWLVSSFDHGVVDQMRKLFPELPTGLLSWREPWQGVIRHAVNNGHLAIHPDESMVDGQLVREAHAAGIEVNTWTVNDPERGIELAELGVDGLITDVPHEMLEVLGHLQ
ncbi:MAG: glycerophosphodiester phosphodiesterase [Actinomycetota bacterium]|nr:glycerophosphodiester phosphodiesterase [Acidimicrobiales bacterium]MEC8921938.1 glycerophosphodiester phosphodiesterase [Actinomycetota bacterium]MED5553015.1 glycerophosphodiester phosphodiesterase [Actinomycetota bacterium]MEE3140855.1 glycerophosphodiester phosphodiesterase [Actinomycetota bacterium]MEE3186404.1 glycerophosphodiester phosphodiesterase [Actinomycetota bacterium]